MNPDNASVQERLIMCYHDLLRKEYEKFRQRRGDIANSRLDKQEVDEICRRFSFTCENLVRMGLLVPLTRDHQKFHTQHMALVEKLVKVQPWPNLPPVPLEHDLVMSEEVKIPALEVDLEEFVTLLEERIKRPGLQLAVDMDKLRRVLQVVWEALEIEKLYRFQAEYSAEILASLLGGSSKEVFSLAAPTGMGKTEAFILPSLVYSLLVSEKGVKVLLVYPRKSLERDQLQKLVRALTKINMRLNEIDRSSTLRLGIDDGDSFRSEAHIKRELEEIERGNNRRSLTFRGIKCPICVESEKSNPGRISWHLIDERRLSLRCDIDSSHVFDYITDIKQSIWDEPPDILITNIHTLNRRLMYRESKKIFGGNGLIGPRIVVLDEAHVYRGLFGGFVHYILKRLAHRLEKNGLPRPVWVISSATMGDPKGFARELIGTNFNRIYYRDYFVEGKDRSKGDRIQLHLMLAPKPNGSGEWLLQQTLLILAVWSLSTGRKFINFVDSVELTKRIWNLLVNVVLKRHDMGEQWRHLSPKFLKDLANNYSLDDLLSAPYSWLPLVYPLLCTRVSLEGVSQNCSQISALLGDISKYVEKQALLWEKMIDPLVVTRLLNEGSSVIRFHNARLRREERYRTEEDLKSGRVIGVISTSTLEMGIDIGDVSVIVQYRPPPSMESYIQRIGRGGRSDLSLRVALGILVLTNSPNDLWYAYGDRFREFIKMSGRIQVVKDNRRVERWSVIFSLMDILASREFDAVLRGLTQELRGISNPWEGLTHISNKVEALRNRVGKRHEIKEQIIKEITETLDLEEDKVRKYIDEFMNDLEEVKVALRGYLRELLIRILENKVSRSRILHEATDEGRFVSTMISELRRSRNELRRLTKMIESEILGDNGLLGYIGIEDRSELEEKIKGIEISLDEINDISRKLHDFNISLRGDIEKISKDLLKVSVKLYFEDEDFTTANIIKEIREKLPKRKLSQHLRKILLKNIADIRIEVEAPSPQVPEIITKLRDDLDRLLVNLRKPFSMIMDYAAKQRRVEESEVNRERSKGEDEEDYLSLIQTILENFSKTVLNMRGLPLIDKIISVMRRR